MLPTWIRSWLIIRDLKVTHGITNQIVLVLACEDCPLPREHAHHFTGHGFARTTCPRGSPEPKSCTATRLPEYAHLGTGVGFAVVKKRPRANVHSRMAKKSGVEPKTVVSQF